MSEISQTASNADWRPREAALTGYGVTLRTLDPEADGATLFARSHGDPTAESVWRFMPYGPFADEDTMHDWLIGCAQSSDPAFRVIVTDDHGPVGMASYLNLVAEHRRLELGHIWYTPAIQGTTVNTATIALMLGESFDRMGGSAR